MASPGRHCGGAPSWGLPRGRLVTATARGCGPAPLIAAVYLYVGVVDSLSIYVAGGCSSAGGSRCLCSLAAQ